MRIPPLLAVLFAAHSGVLPAQVLNIDFNASGEPYVFAGLAAVPDAAGETAVWNQITGGGPVCAGALVDSSGNVTRIGIDLAGIGGFAGLEGDQEPGACGGLMAGYRFLSAPADTEVPAKAGSIRGLAAGRAYDIHLFSQGNKFMGASPGGENRRFTTAGGAGLDSRDGISGGDGVPAGGIETVKNPLPADAGGRICLTRADVVRGPADAVAAAVPEPEVAFLGCLGLLALMLRWRG